MTNEKIAYLKLKTELKKTLDNYAEKITKLEKETKEKTSSIKQKMAEFSVFKIGDYVEVMNEISNTTLFTAIIDTVEVNDLGEIGYGLEAVDPSTLRPIQDFNHIHKSKRFRSTRLKKIQDVQKYLNGIDKETFGSDLDKINTAHKEVKEDLFELYINTKSDIKINDNVSIKEHGITFEGRVFNIIISLAEESFGELIYVVEFHNPHLQCRYKEYNRASLMKKKESAV